MGKSRSGFSGNFALLFPPVDKLRRPQKWINLFSWKSYLIRSSGNCLWIFSYLIPQKSILSLLFKLYYFNCTVTYFISCTIFASKSTTKAIRIYGGMKPFIMLSMCNCEMSTIQFCCVVLIYGVIALNGFSNWNRYQSKPYKKHINHTLKKQMEVSISCIEVYLQLNYPPVNPDRKNFQTQQVNSQILGTGPNLLP